MRYKVIIFVLLCMIAFPVIAQQHKSEFPYRMVGGKMIVEMRLNGTLRSFIFDTGASRTTLTGEVCRELGLAVSDSLEVTDANGHKAHYPLVSIANIQTPEGKFEFRGLPAMKLPEPSPFACFQVDGLVGSDLLDRFIVVIDGKKSTITITSPEKESTVSLRKMSRFVQAKMPIFTLQAGVGNNLVCLFDTGCPRFLSLKKTDFEGLKATSALSVLSEGVSQGAISIGGVAPVDALQRVFFPLLSVAGTKFKNVTVETATPPYTLLGVELLKYGKVTIDYPRSRFYFEPYGEENDLSCGQNDIGLSVKDGELIVASVWDALKGQVEIGDKVTRINGKPVGKYDFCESIINGIPELKAKKKNKLTVQTRQGEKVFVYLNKSSK